MLITHQTSTPWGRPDHIEPLADGFYFVSTPSHGGYFVPENYRHLIPLAWREATWNRQGMSGWFEEDCDWCLVAVCFTRLFSEDAIEPAKRAFEWFAEQHGIEVPAPLAV